MKSPQNAAFFDRSESLLLRLLSTENLCPSATVVHVHDGALAEGYAVSSTTLVAVEVCLYGSLQRWMYVTRSISHTESRQDTTAVKF